MSLLAFEHAIGVNNPIKRELMKLGSGGEIIHVEFILPTYQNTRASSWDGFGVELRKDQVNLRNFVVFEIGNYDKQIYDYFKAREGFGYSWKDLFSGMILKLNPVQKQEFFCSQIVYDVLMTIVQLNLPNRIPSQVSPQKLYEMILNLGLPQIIL